MGISNVVSLNHNSTVYESEKSLAENLNEVKKNFKTICCPPLNRVKDVSNCIRRVRKIVYTNVNWPGIWGYEMNPETLENEHTLLELIS